MIAIWYAMPSSPDPKSQCCCPKPWKIAEGGYVTNGINFASGTSPAFPTLTFGVWGTPRPWPGKCYTHAQTFRNLYPISLAKYLPSTVWNQLPMSISDCADGWITETFLKEKW